MNALTKALCFLHHAWSEWRLALVTEDALIWRRTCLRCGAHESKLDEKELGA